MGLDIKCYPMGMYSENTYLITDEATNFKAIIDPGYFGTEVRMDIESNAYLKYVFLTHAHHDHYDAAKAYLEEYTGARFAAPSKDMPLLEKAVCPNPSLLLNDGDEIELGETVLKVISTPGHTGGGICLLADNVLFSGDTLFKLSVGRTDLETGNWDQLVDSIKNRLYTLDEDTVVYPGHGSSTTIGYEKKANPFV